MKNPTVSIGISAYNEQANIANVITSFLYQKETNFILKEIIVISDGSNDETVELVKGFRDVRIKLISHLNRAGKAKRLNEIVQYFCGDYLLLTDADVLPNDQLVFEKVFNIFRNNDISLIMANVRPLDPVTFFESSVNNYFYARETQQDKFDFLNSVYGARGAGLFLSKKFAKSLIFPDSLILDDVFIYMIASVQNLKIASAPNAIIWYRSVQNPKDFLKQQLRYMKGGEQLRNFFDDKLLEKESFIPKNVMIYILLNQIKKSFLGYLYLKIVFLYCRYIIRFYNYKITPKWAISKSSKKLQSDTSFDSSTKLLLGSRLIKLGSFLKGVFVLWQ